MNKYTIALLATICLSNYSHVDAFTLPSFSLNGNTVNQESTNRSIGFSQCKQLFPNQKPIDTSSINTQWKSVELCSSKFAVVYSKLSKTPLIVVERLNKDQLVDAANEKRSNEFYPDNRLSKGDRAELHDYAGSSYDRGHNAPAGDMPDVQSMNESFALSNMVPQDATMNRGVWGKIESDVRKYVRRSNGNVFVFTGPLFGADYKMIGKNRVWVPTEMFKLVFDESSGKSWAYILPNADTAKISKPMSYQDFVKATGWNLL